MQKYMLTFLISENVQWYLFPVASLMPFGIRLLHLHCFSPLSFLTKIPVELQENTCL